MQVQFIPLNEIDDNYELNCRGQITPIDVIDLAKDIKNRGLIQPIVICPYDDAQQMETGKKYRLLAGFRRFMAHKVNEAKVISAIVREMASEIEALTFNLSENIQRKDLNVYQEALAIKKLKNFGLSEADTGQQLGMSRGWVQVRFMLLGLPEEVQKEAAAGMINQQNIRDLYTLFKKTNDKEQLFEAVKHLKDQKARGSSGRLKVTSNRTKKNQKKIRNRAEIFDMQEIVRKCIGNGITTRALAWVAGEITDAEFFMSLKSHANELGIDFEIPEMEVA